MKQLFYGGVHPAEHKEATEQKPIQPLAKAPAQVVIPMSMHIGAPCKPTVQKGDTLWGITQTYGTTVAALAERNGLANPDRIYPGQVIQIGGQASVVGKTYTVRKGDSLWAIAARELGSGGRYGEIKAANGLSGDTIYPGQVLDIPR